ncbi:MAG: TonB-dependent receptor [Sphingobacteriales bacterium]
MKITLGQVFIAIVLTGISYASTGKAQAVLDKQVTITLNNASLGDALKSIEKDADVKFVYSKSIIKTTQQVSIVAKQERLETILKQLLVPNGINYEMLDNHIVLSKRNPEPPNEPIKTSLTVADVTQQQVVISGTVTSTTGETLPGVSIMLKGTAIGTTTDANGRFSISLPDANGTLVFSYIGYESQEVALGGRTRLNVSLTGSDKSLNEVVVIGYQAVRKRDLTGAVSVINTAEANKVTSSSVVESLQGLSPGVTVRTSGAPGNNPEIEIRGIGSLLSSAPLYVIDGMVSDANVTINNDDVESIQVLKDASAAAIYGSRAANGVIIITTKQGKTGPAKVNFSVKYGRQQLPKKWGVMDASQYAATKRLQYANAGVPDDQLPPSIATGTFNSAINTNWQNLDERTGNDADYNISISGGSEHSKYLVSASYYDDQSVLKAYSFNRTSFRINTGTTKGILTFGENALLTNTNTWIPTEGNPFYDLPTDLPTIPVSDPKWITSTNPQGFTNGTNDQGQYTDITYANNIIAGNQVANQYTNNAKIVGNAYIQLNLTSWLYYKFNAGLETSFDYTHDLFLGVPIRYGTPSASSTVDETRGQFTNTLLEHTINFNKTFGVHNINGVFGFSEQSEKDVYTGAGRTNLTYVDGTGYLQSINSASGNPTASGGTNNPWKIISYLGRVNYTFNDKYLLTATGRIDEDSRFGANYRTGFFPSIAGAWRINKESFFKADWVNDLKLSASYGVLGINTIPAYANQGFINTAPRAVFGNDIIENGAYQASLYNPDVHWESRHETNIGLDATILHNKVTVSIAVYNNVSKDALLIEQLPNYLGANDNPYINAGSISNKGIEFSATYRNSDHKLKWNISGNFTTIKNKVLSVGDQGGSNYIVQNPDFTRAEIGHPVGSWYVLKDEGIFQSQAEVNAYKRSNGDLIEPFAKPGDIKFYANPNGTGTLNNNDRVFDGSSLPTLQTGLQFNANYQQFTLSIQLVGQFGNTIFDAVRETLDSYQNTNFRSDISPWTSTNTNTSDPRLGFATDPGINSNNTQASSRWLENGSYGRIRNLELGYMLPKNVLSKWHVDNARIFISGQNLLTVTKYKGLDPDVEGNLLQPGYDNGGWPPSRVFSIGVNCGF